MPLKRSTLRGVVAVATLGALLVVLAAQPSWTPWADDGDDREDDDVAARSESPSEPAEVPAGVALADLRSAPAPAMCGNPAGTMVDGQSMPVSSPGSGITGLLRSAYFAADDWSITAAGDLTGDGVAEGVAVLFCTSGTGAVESQAVVYRDGPSILSAIPLAGAVGARIHDGVLDVVALHPSDGDPECCPSIVEARTFRFDGDRVIQVDHDLDASQPLEPGAWGQLRLGGTYADAALALGAPLDVTDGFGGDVAFSPDGDACLSATTIGGGPIDILGSGDRTAALYVDDPAMRTTEDIGIGSTSDDVHSAYGDQVVEADNIYHEAPDLYVGSPESPEGTPGIRFVLDDATRQVGWIMVGEFPGIMAAEGCA